MPSQGRKLLYLRGLKDHFEVFFYEILLSGATFGLFYILNLSMTSSITPIYGAHWIFLPAGARLLLTLVFPISGPIGIGISAFLIAYFFRLPGQLITALGIGITVGVSPFISRLIVVRQFKILPDLSNISITKIFYCTLVFSAVSAVLHHSWYVYRDLRLPGFNGFGIEFVGNAIGTFLVLSFFKILAEKFIPANKSVD
ncbi:hypothetical protein [Polynucleobacter sp. UB-Tiil-W10]|uniref:hypothetical protein n=1 Tax=Polynucleobacter sp. UB-Tiil-W10 TaxID=1855648 RepID=UPI001C0D0E8E|nr:hypothetical protein [Polynucleobacter sp. UB-Tiil-W10]MBU3539663.1 hypothetical protein [Polynucleobacter sp. UB-Tiil-W10]